MSAETKPDKTSRWRPFLSKSRAGWFILAFGAALTVLSVIVHVSDQDRGNDLAVGTDNRSAAETPTSTTTQRALSLISLPDSSRGLTKVDKLAQKRTADADDWDSEVLTDRINRQLELLATGISNREFNNANVSELFVDGFSCNPLRPVELSETYRDSRLIVRVATAESTGSTAIRDTSDLIGLLREMPADLYAIGTPRVKFKLFHIEHGAAQIATRVYYEASARNDQSGIQQNATWQCRWVFGGDGHDSIRLSQIVVQQFSESFVSGPGGALFDDVTRSVMADNLAYRHQVLPGMSHWLVRLSREFMGQFGHHGLAVADVNGDGLDDLYVCDAGGLPNRLYLQNSDGTLRDVSADSGVNLLEDSVGALLIDLDNDGDQDLIVASDPLVQFAENNGAGRFTLRDGFYANTDSYSLSAADYDDDGRLDLYVCGYNVRKQDAVNRGLPFPLPYHDANNGGRNYLLRNEGEFQFQDVTDQVGLNQNNTRFSLAASWEDFDNDGDLDLYVANDFGRNCLYRNDSGRFTDVAAKAGVEDHASGMSVSWGDYDRDGWMDVYVGNMFSAAGNRVTYQRKFSDGLDQHTIGFVRRMARGNTLFRNGSEGIFRDVSLAADVTMGRWAWASRFVDLNNDGWQDIVVANGYVTNEDNSDL